MSDRIGPFLARDFDHSLGDEGTRNTGAEKILVLINRARLDHWEDEIPRELLLQIVNIDLGRARRSRFLVEPAELFLLADVCAESDHLGVVLLFNPREQNRGVESARIS